MMKIIELDGEMIWFFFVNGLAFILPIKKREKSEKHTEGSKKREINESSNFFSSPITYRKSLPVCLTPKKNCPRNGS
jgi:hypothetical protein